MKKLYNLIFVITLLLITGLITNVNAVSLSNSEGRITVTREVTDVHNPVTNTFKYGVDASNGNPATVTGLPSSFNIVFNRTTPVIASGDLIGTATQTGTLDLTGINFTKVGDYTFYLWEQNSTNSSNYPVDENNRYKILVSVRNVLDSNRQPTGALEASLAYIKKGNLKVSDVVFGGGVSYVNISIAKEVQGNMADPDEYFKVLVDIDCPTGDTYPMSYYDVLNDTYDVDRTISYNGSSINRMPNGNSEYGYYATYTCGQNNYVYLKHGERAKIYSLLNETEYSFIEQDATNYQTYINGSNTNSKSSGTLSTPEIEAMNDRVCSNIFYDCYYSSDPSRTNIIGKEIKTKNMANETPTFDYDVEDGQNIILNVESSPVPTGAIIKYLPYAILVLVTLGGLTFFIIAKRRTNEENI